MSPQARAKAMYERYASGASLQDVGDHFGITRERVRQVLEQSGYSTKEARKLRNHQKQRELEAKVVTRLHATHNIQGVAREFNLPVGTVRKLAKNFVPKAQDEVKTGSRVPNGYWTKARIVEAIRLWAAEYGSPPHATDWNIAAIRAKGEVEREERFMSGLWPHLNTVRSKFGNWNVAIEEAGYEPTPVSSYGRPGDSETLVAEGESLYRSGVSLGEAAARAGISPATLERRLGEAGEAPSDLRVPEIEELLAGRNWTPVTTVAECIKHGGPLAYRALRERTDLFELLEISDRGLHARLKRQD